MANGNLRLKLCPRQQLNKIYRGIQGQVPWGINFGCGWGCMGVQGQNPTEENLSPPYTVLVIGCASARLVRVLRFRRDSYIYLEKCQARFFEKNAPGLKLVKMGPKRPKSGVMDIFST